MIYSAPRQGLFLLIISISFFLHTIVMMVSTENEVEKNRIQKGERLVAQLIDESALALTYEDRVSLSVIARRYTQEYDVNRIIIKNVNDELLVQVGDAPLQEAGEVINELATRNNAVIGRVEMVLMSTSMSEIAKMMSMTIFGSFFFHLMLWFVYNTVARPTKEQLRSLSREIQTYYFPDNHYLDPIEEQRRIAEEEENIELELLRLRELEHKLVQEQEKISQREESLAQSYLNIKQLQESALISNNVGLEVSQQEINQSESNTARNNQEIDNQQLNNQKLGSHNMADQTQPDYLSEKIKTIKTEPNTGVQDEKSTFNIHDIKISNISKISNSGNTIASSVIKATGGVKSKFSALLTKISISANKAYKQQKDITDENANKRANSEKSNERPNQFQKTKQQPINQNKSKSTIESSITNPKSDIERTKASIEPEESKSDKKRNEELNIDSNSGAILKNGIESNASTNPSIKSMATAQRKYSYSMATEDTDKGIYARKTGVSSHRRQPAPSHTSSTISATRDTTSETASFSTTVVTDKELATRADKPYDSNEYERQRAIVVEEIKSSAESSGRQSNNAIFKKHSLGKELSAFLGQNKQVSSNSNSLFQVQTPQKSQKQEQQIPTIKKTKDASTNNIDILDLDLSASLISPEMPYSNHSFNNTEDTIKSAVLHKPLQVKISFVDKYSLLRKLSDDMANSYLILCSQLLRQASIELLKLPMLSGISIVNKPTFDKEGAVVELQSISTISSTSSTNSEQNQLALAGMMLAALYKMLNEIIYDKHRELGQFALTVVIGISISEQKHAMQKLLSTRALDHDVMMLLAQPEMNYIEKHIRVSRISTPSNISERECVYVKAIDNDLLKEITKVRNSVLQAD